MLAAVGNRILDKIISVSVFPFSKAKKKKEFKGVGVTYSNECDAPVPLMNCFYYVLRN